MRVLNKKQKKLIDEWFDKKWTGAGSIYTYAQMPIELFEELEKINDHETIWQNIQRYISDKASDKLYKK